MNERTEEILKIVSDWKASSCDAYSIREDGKGIAIRSSQHIRIVPKKDRPGLDIFVDDGTKGERLAIPACVTHGGIDDLVYNDFHIGKDCSIDIEAGCGVHAEHGEAARHNGIHHFIIGDGSYVRYIEKHIGLGKGIAKRSIDPVTSAEIGNGSTLEIDSVQLGGVSQAKRTTRATVASSGSFVVHERILT